MESNTSLIKLIRYVEQEAFSHLSFHYISALFTGCHPGLRQIQIYIVGDPDPTIVPDLTPCFASLALHVRAHPSIFIHLQTRLDTRKAQHI